jgi:hypothetical protein
VPDATPTTIAPSRPRHFRRHWWRAVVPGAFAIGLFGMFAHRIPDGVWAAVPGLAFVLVLCAALHGGLVVSPAGIEWYAVRPRWRYRAVPWDAVLDVRGGPLGLLPARLIVKPGRYEPWVWGKPSDRPMEFELWPTGYAGGEEMMSTLRRFWSSRNPSDGLG